MDESKLIAIFQSDEPGNALTALFEAYADKIYRLALSILKDPSRAEDVVQETFLSALDKRAQFKGNSRLSTWLYRIAYNASLNRLRRKTEEPLPPDEPDPDSGSAPMPQALVDWRFTPEEILGDLEARQELENAIVDLPETLRVVFLLRDVEELSTDETAEALGISSGAVKVRLHRARLALRERVASYFAERVKDWQG